jgi:hypothetical protein
VEETEKEENWQHWVHQKGKKTGGKSLGWVTEGSLSLFVISRWKV